MQEAVVYNKVLGYAVRGFGVFVRLVSTTDSLTSTRQWLYNRRSELVGASGTQTHPDDYAYSYDSIGNRLTSSDDFGTATFADNTTRTIEYFWGNDFSGSSCISVGRLLPFKAL